MKLFTSPTCGPCRILKGMIDKEGIDVTIIDATSISGAKEAMKYKLCKVPVLVNDDEVVFNGIDKIKVELGLD